MTQPPNDYGRAVSYSILAQRFELSREPTKHFLSGSEIERLFRNESFRRFQSDILRRYVGPDQTS
jgi:hypothetical protein